MNALEDSFDLKETPESHKMMLVKNSLTGSALGWYQIFLSKDTSYDHFRCNFLEFYWDHSKQALLRERINHGKFQPKSKRDMVDYLIELAQLSRLLNPPLKDDEFFNLAIQHFPQEVRSALIVAKPADFGEAVSLLKKLQCRKLSERSGEVNLGIYHPGRQSARAATVLLFWGERQEPLKPPEPPRKYRAKRQTARENKILMSGKIAQVPVEKGETVGEIKKIGEERLEITKIISWTGTKALTTASEAGTRTGTIISEMAAVQRELTSSAPSIKTRTGTGETGHTG